MATRYELTFCRRLVNAIVGPLTAWGRGSKTSWLHTVRGRKAATERTTPVVILEDAAGRWLVAPMARSDGSRTPGLPAS